MTSNNNENYNDLALEHFLLKIVSVTFLVLPMTVKQLNWDVPLLLRKINFAGLWFLRLCVIKQNLVQRAWDIRVDVKFYLLKGQGYLNMFFFTFYLFILLYFKFVWFLLRFFLSLSLYLYVLTVYLFTLIFLIAHGPISTWRLFFRKN